MDNNGNLKPVFQEGEGWIVDDMDTENNSQRSEGIACSKKTLNEIAGTISVEFSLSLTRITDDMQERLVVESSPSKSKRLRQRKERDSKRPRRSTSSLLESIFRCLPISKQLC